MVSKRDRLRKLERARIERRIARQAAQTRRRRQVQAGIGAVLSVAVIVVGTVWLLGGFDSKPQAKETVARGTCTWNLKDAATDPNVIDVGHPPTTGEKRSGTEKLTIRTNLGDVEASLDLTRTPCTTASLAYLSEKKYYEGVKCHRLDTEASFLACGDPKGDGSGLPSYSFSSEYLPPPVKPTTAPSAGASASPDSETSVYRKGTIVLANSGPDNNGGQFFIIYGDASTLPGSYSIIGTVTRGLDLVERVAKGGAVDDTGNVTPAGTPKTDLTVEAIYVGAAPAASPAPASSAPATPAA